MTTLRLGSFELKSARDAASSPRHRFSGPSDCLTMLRRHRVDRGAVRALVLRAGGRLRTRSDDEALHALAQLVFRGAYVVVLRAPARVPLLEMPAPPPDIETYDREFEEDEGDGLPTAIVPREYPLLAAREMQAVATAIALANAELDKQLYRSAPREPEDKVPLIYRSDSHTTALEIQSAATRATVVLERLEYKFPADEPSDQLPVLYRSSAEETSAGVASVITGAADLLGRLAYPGQDQLLAAETKLHGDGTPKEFRGISHEKGRGVKDATIASANSLDQLLYQGFPDT